MPLKIREIRAKTILNKSTISDYTLNCYVGCRHACNYCYAKYMSYYRPHTDPRGQCEVWGTYVDVKVNAPEVLEKDIKKKRGKGRGEVMMSSICDGWQPLEARYKLSRRCLDILLKNGFDVSILTKNKLVLRDFDILKRYKDNVDLGLTITTFDHKLQSALEPFSSTSQERLNVIKEANKADINAWVFLGPLIPGFTDTFENLCDLFAKLSKVMLDKIYIDSFHYYKSHYKALERSLGRVYPMRFREFLSPMNYNKKASLYEANLKDNIYKAAEKHGIGTIQTLF